MTKRRGTRFLMILALAFVAIQSPLSAEARAHSELVDLSIFRPDETSPGGLPEAPGTALDGDGLESLSNQSAIALLRFSEELDPGFARVSVIDPTGSYLRTTEAQVTEDRLGVRVRIPTAPDGSYKIAWFVRSRDGDASNGMRRMEIGDALSPLGLLPPIGARDPAWQPPMTWRMTAVSAVLRWLNYLGVMLAGGTLLFWAMVWRRRPGSAGETADAQSEDLRMPGLSGLLLAGLILLFFANVLLLLLQASFLQSANLQPVDTAAPIAVQPTGLPRATAAAAVGEILQTWSGGVWMIRMGLIFFVGFTLGMLHRSQRAEQGQTQKPTQAAPAAVGSLKAATLAAFGLLLSISLTSHAAFVPSSASGRAIAVAFDWTHLIAMVAWLGGLLPLALTLRSTRRGGEFVPGSWPAVRFSRIALVSVIWLVGSGFAATYFQVGSPALLAETAYGVTLTAKLGLVVLMLAAGALNRYFLLPRAAAGAAGPLERSVWFEVGVGALLLLCVALLASLGAASTSWNAHQALGVAESRTVAGAEFTLRLAPGSAGKNALAVDVRDNREGAWRTPGGVRVHLTPHSGRRGDLATQRLSFENTRTERYFVPELVLLEPGDTQISVSLSRRGYEPIEEVFHVEAAQRTQPE